MLQNSRSNLPILLLLSVGAAALFSWMFNQPDRVNSTWHRFPGTAIFTMAQLKAAMLESAVFIVLLVLGQHWLIGQWGGASVPSALTIAVATGIVFDLTREVRAQCIHPKLVPVWEIHQLYAVDPAMRLLAAEGIQVFPRGLHHRVLLQFFGPFVPVHLMVEEEHAQRAQDLLQTPLPS